MDSKPKDAVKEGYLTVSFNKIVVQDDRKTIVGMGVAPVNLSNYPSLVRCNLDGSVDESFNIWVGRKIIRQLLLLYFSQMRSYWLEEVSLPLMV